MVLVQCWKWRKRKHTHFSYKCHCIYVIFVSLTQIQQLKSCRGKDKNKREAESVVPWEEQGVAVVWLPLLPIHPNSKIKKEKGYVQDQGHVPENTMYSTGFLFHSPCFKKTQEPWKLKLLKRNYFPFATFNFDISMSELLDRKKKSFF